MVKPPPTFASLEVLLDHGQRDGFDIRPTLLRVLTDFYLQKAAHPLDDERYYTELALRLISSTDVPARAAVAERLAPYPAAPVRSSCAWRATSSTSPGPSCGIRLASRQPISS